MSSRSVKQAQFVKPERVAPAYNGPTNFCWLVPGILGGTPRPGIFKDTYRDIEALARVQTRLLVTLTEEYKPDVALIESYDIATLYVPIPDLEPPSLTQATQVCQLATAYVARGEAVVFHCHAGKGRTGTLLAAMLIWAGTTAEVAILQTRASNPKWIESESQIKFLHTFASSISSD